MQITPEYLMDLKKKAEEQRQHFLSQVHQATGAIAALETMIARLKEPEKEGA